MEIFEWKRHLRAHAKSIEDKVVGWLLTVLCPMSNIGLVEVNR